MSNTFSCPEQNTADKAPQSNLMENEDLIQKAPESVINHTDGMKESREIPPTAPTSLPCLDIGPSTLPICVVCGQSSSQPLIHSHQLAPFSQTSARVLAELSVEVMTVCCNCAGLLQRLDYHQLMASNIRNGLKTCISAVATVASQENTASSLECSMCSSSVAASPHVLATHMMSHLHSTQLPCAACGRLFGSWRTLRRHALVVHLGVAPSRCRRCPAVFRMSAQLVAHSLQTHGVADGLRCHHCGVCARRFANPHRFVAHLHKHGSRAESQVRRVLAELARKHSCHRPASPTQVQNGEGEFVGSEAQRDEGKAVDGEVQKCTEEVVDTEIRKDKGIGTGARSGKVAIASAGSRTDKVEVVDALARKQEAEVATMVGISNQNSLGEGSFQWRSDTGEACYSRHECESEDSGPGCDVTTALTSQIGENLPGAVSRQKSNHSFNCSQCNRVFRRKQSLQRHVDARHGTSAKLACDQCDKKFSIKFYWQKHVNRHRTKAVQCSNCQRSFVNMRALARHKCLGTDYSQVVEQASRAGHHESMVGDDGEIGGDGGGCRLCCSPTGAVLQDRPEVDGSPCRCGGTRLVRRDQVGLVPKPGTAQLQTTDRPAVHQSQAPPARSPCGSEMTAPASRRHGRSSVERTFQCSTCGKCFRWKSNLDIHVRIHTGERPYQCDVCGHATRCSANLRLHKQRVHSEARPHVCVVCGKAFKERYNLVIHGRSHTGDRPYVCEQCGGGFVTKGKLNSHMSKHSEMRPHVCPLCLRPLKTQSILTKHCRKVHGSSVEETARRAAEQRARVSGTPHLNMPVQYLASFVPSKP